MDQHPERLPETDILLAKLADGNDLTADEGESLFSNIFLNDTTGFRFVALMSAIHAKGETPDELLGLIKFYKKNIANLELKAPADKITDLSGTGGGTFKTLNVSTAASFVVAAAGYTVAKASYFGVSGPMGSADLFASFGIDILKLNKEIIEETLDKVGICPLYTFSISPKLENRGRLFKMVYKDNNIKVRTPAHLTTNVLSPLPINHRIYGCYSEKYLEVLAELFSKLGFKRSLVFYGQIGIPEISNVGRTIIAEQNEKEIKKYTLDPEDLGVEEATENEIKTGGKEQNIKDFINILKGKEKGPKSDLVAINAGASLYSLEDIESIAEGTKKAQEILKSGLAYQKLEQLIQKIGTVESLNNFMN